MKNYEATERAFKNGYEKGYEDGKRVVTDNKVGDKWVPTAERMPEQYETVLCLLPTKECWVATWNEVGDQLWSDGESWCSESHITHWMPLPKPPKEGE